MPYFSKCVNNNTKNHVKSDTVNQQVERQIH